MADRAEIERCIRRLLQARAGKTICPSEVARALDATDFWTLMPAVRDVAAELRTRGELLVTQRGEPVDPIAARGPIRLALASSKIKIGRKERFP